MMNIKLIPFLTLLFLNTSCLVAMDKPSNPEWELIGESTPNKDSEIQIVGYVPAANPRKRSAEESLLEKLNQNCPACRFSSEHATILEDHIYNEHAKLRRQPYLCTEDGCSRTILNFESFKNHLRNYHSYRREELHDYIKKYFKNQKTKAVNTFLQKYKQLKTHKETQNPQLHAPTPVPLAQDVDEAILMEALETELATQLSEPTPVPLAQEADEARLMEDLEAELSAQLSEPTPTQSPGLPTHELPYIYEEHRKLPERREFLEAESQLMHVRAAAQRYSVFPNPPENMQSVGEPLPQLLPSLAAHVHQPLQQIGSPLYAPAAKVPSMGIIGVEELKKKVNDQEKAEKKLLHEGLIFKCSKCGKIQKNLPTLKQHILEHHTQLKQLECDMPGCNFGSNFYAPFSKHMQNAHNKESNTKLSLEKQRKIADELRPYLSECEFECDTCGALFESKKAVSSHKTHTHNTMKNK